MNGFLQLCQSSSHHKLVQNIHILYVKMRLKITKMNKTTIMNSYDYIQYKHTQVMNKGMKGRHASDFSQW